MDVVLKAFMWQFEVSLLGQNHPFFLETEIGFLGSLKLSSTYQFVLPSLTEFTKWV